MVETTPCGVIFRMRLLSATNKFPPLSITIFVGNSNRAVPALPSAKPNTPLPAKDET